MAPPETVVPATLDNDAVQPLEGPRLAEPRSALDLSLNADLHDLAQRLRSFRRADKTTAAAGCAWLCRRDVNRH